MGAAQYAPTTRAPVYIEGSNEHVHETVRRTTSFHPDGDWFTSIHSRLLQHKAQLEEYFGQSLTDCEPPQFLHYREGDFFVRHQDGNTEQMELTIKGATHLDRRVLERVFRPAGSGKLRGWAA